MNIRSMRRVLSFWIATPLGCRDRRNVFGKKIRSRINLPEAQKTDGDFFSKPEGQYAAGGADFRRFGAAQYL